jgi:hypothetical protein
MEAFVNARNWMAEKFRNPIKKYIYLPEKVGQIVLSIPFGRFSWPNHRCSETEILF